MPKSDPPVPSSKDVVRRTERSIRIVVAILGALLTVAAGLVGLSRIGEPIVMLSYDLPFVFHRSGGTDDIRIVYLSELDKQAIDRTRQAELLDQLSQAGARMVVYDLIFDRPSEDPGVDAEFAAAIRRFRGVDEAGNPLPNAAPRHVFLACGRRTFRTSGVIGEQLIPPNYTLLDAADDFGLVAVNDESYMVRRLSTGTPDEPALVWKAAVAAGSRLEGEDRMATRWMNYAGPPRNSDGAAVGDPIPSCPAESLLSGPVEPAFLRDKIVLIGGEPGIVGEALGKDLFETPFHRFQIGGKMPFMSGVEVQANALANLINRSWLTRSDPKSDRILVLIAGILIGVIFSLMRPSSAIVSSLVLLLVLALAGVLTIHDRGVWFPWTAVAFLQLPVALVWGIASASYVDRHFRIRLTEEQRAIRGAFAKYLSPQMLDRLTQEGFATNLGGEKVEATMVFTDLEGFTDMCERIEDPERIIETMNEYFERTTASIFDHDGVVIKFIGDAIFAAWGAPIPEPESALYAARAAWKLFVSDKLVVDGESLRTRIGIHHGTVVAGNLGSSRRVDYTLVGDAVNLASRLESANKTFGTSILMSDAVAEKLGTEFRTRRVGSFRVKGRREPVTIFELLGPARQASDPEWLVAYHAALAKLEEGDLEAALAGFAEVDAIRDHGGDGPARFFIRHLRAGEPVEGGVVELKEK